VRDHDAIRFTLRRMPKKRQPFQFVPVIALAILLKLSKRCPRYW